jgi:hypothetical protein
MALVDRIAAVLAPQLGTYSADAVARHICVKYAIDEDAGAEKLQQLRDFLRRGLVAYVGAELADSLASQCVHLAAESREEGP